MFLNKVIKLFNDVATAQEHKGVEKYGHELRPHDTKWDWLEMAEEEIVDAFKYLAAEKERRNVVLNTVIKELRAVRKKVLANEIQGAKFDQSLLTTNSSIRGLDNSIRMLRSMRKK